MQVLTALPPREQKVYDSYLERFLPVTRLRPSGPAGPKGGEVENRQAKQHHKGSRDWLWNGKMVGYWGLASIVHIVGTGLLDPSLVHLVHLQHRLAQNTWCRRGRL